MSETMGVVILAAGEGKRLKLDCPKPLAPCGGLKLVDYSIRESHHFIKNIGLHGKVTAVIGHAREKVESYIKASYSGNSHMPVAFAIQEKQLGTADALKSYFNADKNNQEFTFTVVLCADNPVIRSEDLKCLYDEMLAQKWDAIAATIEELTPKGYGRIVRSIKGFHIVEEKDASEIERKITEVNSGVYILRTQYVLEMLQKVKSDNKAGEFYLTDIFQDGANVGAYKFNSSEPFLGVNTLEQLQTVENIVRRRKKLKLREEGVYFVDISHVWIDEDVKIGQGTMIQPNVYLAGKTEIGTNVKIMMGSHIENSKIEDGAEILPHSVLENCHVGKKAHVGPFARLRPGADLGEEAKVGNFVEIKKSKLEKGVKVSHLSYVGDAFVGENSNVGCGFITCNYDGVNKHVTKIGKDCFIGSDSQAVAPVEIGDGCFVAAGSTITHNMPDGSFAISRGKQMTKEGMAKKFIKKKE